MSIARGCLLSATILTAITSVDVYVTAQSPSHAAKACQLLQTNFPDLVSFPGLDQFMFDVKHWANSSSQTATCSIEPVSACDVSSILKIIGQGDIRSPFAIKSRGHAYNTDFSSTEGVQISMSRFSQLTYDNASNTVTIGAGLTWGQVYSQLEPFGVVVVGGRTNGVGVAGLTLGGGYSWKTNQYGLSIDTVVAYNLVLPSGEEVHVSNSSYPDLFFGLKGGLNNFGIVTNITLEAHRQTSVYGGTILHAQNVTSALNAAISNFSVNNTDPKAQIIASYASVAAQFVTEVMLFYDGPRPPSHVFDELLSIPNLSSTVKTRTFSDFVSDFGPEADFGIGPFGYAAHVVPITHYTVPLLEEFINQTIALANVLTAANNGIPIFVTVSAEPFTNQFTHSRGGAYPHSPSRQVTPATPQIAYPYIASLDPATQATLHQSIALAVKQFSSNIQAKAVAEGVSSWDDLLYPNYALADTPLELLYGRNVETLKQIALKYDPNRIMSLTGGFRFWL